jgi:hypothetical protein
LTVMAVLTSPEVTSREMKALTGVGVGTGVGEGGGGVTPLASVPTAARTAGEMVISRPADAAATKMTIAGMTRQDPGKRMKPGKVSS